MFKKIVTYTDFDGNERTEEFCFNMTKAEVVEMQLEQNGGLSNLVKKAIDSKDVPTLIKTFKELVLRAYGVKSPDGKRFIKTPEVVEEFTQTNAYSEIFMELATDADAASAFVNGITPEGLDKYLTDSAK